MIHIHVQDIPSHIAQARIHVFKDGGDGMITIQTCANLLTSDF